MSAKPILEVTGKDLLNKFLTPTAVPSRFVSVNEKTNLANLGNEYPWLNTTVS